MLKVPPQFIPDPATLSNYQRVLFKEDFGLYFLNSLLVSVSSTTISVLLSAMMAYGFARYRFPGREWLFRILLLGLMIPAMMLIVPNSPAREMAGTDRYAAGIDRLLCRRQPRAQHVPAARVLRGAARRSSTTRCRSTARPRGAALRRPRPSTCSPCSGDSHHLYLPRHLGRICLGTHRYHQPREQNAAHRRGPAAGPRGTQWGLVFAASIIAILPVIVVFLIFQRHFVQGLTAGAVKG